MRKKLKIKTLVVGPLLTNCYILISGPEAIIIDPGAEVEKIFNEVKEKKVNFIILTHYHWDHTLGVLKLKEITGAKILIHKEEKEFINFQPDHYLSDEEKIQFDEFLLKIIHTPGHTKGSISILIENFLFTGDTLFKDGVGRTDLAGGSAKDLIKSLEKVKKIINPETIIYPGHGDCFLGKEFL